MAKKYILEYIKGEEIPEDLPFEISGKIYCFKENFLRLVGKTPFNANIRDYANGVIDYMNNSYPYCFAKNFNAFVSFGKQLPPKPIPAFDVKIITVFSKLTTLP